MTEGLNSTQESTSIPKSTDSALSPQTSEKTLSQDEVNRLVSRVKHESYEKGKQEANSGQYQSATHNQAASTIPAQNTFSGMHNITQGDIENLVTSQVQKKLSEQHQMAQRQLYEQQAQNIHSDLNSKFNDAKSRYEDFNDVVNNDSLSSIPDILVMAHKLDNSADVIYDLLKNPGKLGAINGNIMASRANQSPYLQKIAEQHLKQLSDSIKQNQSALSSKPQVNEPLSQIKPSVAGADNGSKTISDLRKKPWLRA